MRIFVAGASGAVGRRLVPMLVERGHDVAGTTRNQAKADLVETLGAQPVVLDALDQEQVMAGVMEFKPDAIIHQLTAIGGAPDLRRFDHYFAATNRLRTEGTDNLVAAARAAGTRRIVAQSYAGWPAERTGGPVKTEADPFDPQPPANARETLAAIRHLERAVMTATPVEGVVLRYGGFYGPGNAVGADGELLAMIRRRRLPIIGGGTGIWSFVHIDDAASAAVIAAEGGPQGIYNIVDDEPAEVRVWLPYLAEAIGAKRPMRLPAWLLRPMLGEHATSMMTRVRGASNAKAKAELGWRPAFGSWREGFRTGLG
jgi:nucleoside-diphosphate-sugar epimerase